MKGKPMDLSAGGTQSGALCTSLAADVVPDDGQGDPQLGVIVSAWPMLPAAIRAGIVAMVEAMST